MHSEIWITPPASALQNMAFDEELLKSLASTRRCILHCYRWEADSITYGYFIDPYVYLNKEEISKRKIQLARRPTGGGIIFHHCDLAFSALIPSTHPAYSMNTLDNYAFINKAVSEAIRRLNGSNAKPNLLLQEQASDEYSRQFCMAKPTKYDVMIDGRKVGGGAQRRTKYGFLHQGSIALTIPSEEYLDHLLIPGTCVATSMQRNSYALLDKKDEEGQLTKVRQEMQSLLMDTFRHAIRN